MKKLLLKIIVVVIVLLVALFLLRNFIARKSVEVGFTKVTGFPLQIQSVNLTPTLTNIQVHGLNLNNPDGFEDKNFVALPLFTVDYKLGSMIAGSPHITEMVIKIDQITIIKNAKGESNLARLKGVAGSGSESGKEESKTKYQVDTLKIHIGKITTKDFSKAKPSERNINLNVDATYNNISDSTDITRLVLLTMASQIHLTDFGVNTDGLKKSLGNVTDTAGKAFKGATDAGKGLLDNLKKAVPQK